MATTPIDLRVAPAPNEPATLAIGARAPDFQGLLGVDGRRYGLSTFADRDFVVLIFSSNRCPTAKAYTDRLNKLQAEYGPRGVQLLAINSNDPHLYSEESYGRMVERSNEAGYSFPYVFDEGQRVARAYWPTRTFHAFLLDRTRRLRYEGRFDDSRLEGTVTSTDLTNALDDLLAGRGVRIERTEPFGCTLDLLVASEADRTRRAAVQPVVWAAVGVAWLIALAAQLTGDGALLHHHSLIGSGPPFALAALASTSGWLVMAAAMMLPASVRSIDVYAAAARAPGAMSRPVAGFLLAYLVVWVLFGLACFLGDVVLHRIVDTTPWLAARSWLIEASLVGVVGAYQFLPIKRRFLAACRHPAVTAHADRAAFEAGLGHAVDCVLSAGPIMLLMFAAGFANLWWMLGLTLFMYYETFGGHGPRAARVAGVALLGLAIFALATHTLPFWASA